MDGSRAFESGIAVLLFDYLTMSVLDSHEILGTVVFSLGISTSFLDRHAQSIFLITLYKILIIFNFLILSHRVGGLHITTPVQYCTD